MAGAKAVVVTRPFSRLDLHAFPECDTILDRLGFRLRFGVVPGGVGVEFAVDQQPYLQGYLAIDSLWLYKNNGDYMGGGEQPVLTGPAFVDKSNVDKVASFAAKGTR